MPELSLDDFILDVLAEAKRAIFLHNEVPKQEAYKRLTILEEIIKNVRIQKAKSPETGEREPPESDLEAVVRGTSES